MIYSLLSDPAGNLYASRYGYGQTTAEAVLTVDPVPADLANLTPADFTDHPFESVPNPARFTTLVEVFQFAPGTGAITPSYSPTAAEYEAHFDVDLNAPGIPGTKTLE